MDSLHKYDNSFEPLLLEKMTAKLYAAELPESGLSVECVWVGALPEYTKDFGSLTGGTWSNDNEDTNLELSDMEFSQLRMKVVDDLQIRLKNPAATSYWRTNKTNFYLPQFPFTGTEWEQNYMFKVSEFFVWEDDTPRFDLYSAASVSIARVKFTGWKFKVALTDKPPKIEIWLNGYPPATSRSVNWRR